MSIHFSSIGRFTAVALACALASGVTTSSAWATTVRQGTTTTLPAFGSPPVAIGASVGSNTLVGDANYTRPNSTGGAPYSGSCGIGNLRGTIATNGTGAGNAVQITSPVLVIGNASGAKACGADTDPNYDVISLSLASSSGASVSASSTGSSTVSLQGPRFTLKLRTASGVVFSCPSMRPVGADAIVGTAVNGTTTSGASVPRLSFPNVGVYYGGGGGGLCASEFGDNSSASKRTLWNFTFGPLRLNPSTSTSSPFVGVFNP